MQNLAGVVREGDPMGEADQKNTNYTVIVSSQDKGLGCFVHY